MSPAIVWLLTAALLLLGLLGSVVPGLPGAPVIFAAAVWHELFLPQYLSGPTLALLGLLACLSAALDLLLSAAGGRRMGATYWGVMGAGLGAMVGIFFGPLGLFAGAVGGAAAAELLLAGKPINLAARAGLGAGLGLLVSTAAKALLALFMVGLFLADCFLL